MTEEAKRLLVIAHAPSHNIRRMGAAILDGAAAPEIDNVQSRLIAAVDARPEDVWTTQAVILLTPENLGYMSGALKDFFDRCYYPCLERTQGLPYALCVRAGHDGAGTQRGVETIVTGLRWRKSHAPLVCRGEWRESFLNDCYALGAHMAAGLDVGIY
jgi:hypothetical protein